MDTYHMCTTCLNCCEFNSLDIPKGTTFVEYGKTHLCEHCGCPVYFTPLEDRVLRLERILLKLMLVDTGAI